MKTWVGAAGVYKVHYFSVRVIGGDRKIQDPDNLIYDISWKSAEEIVELNLSFPEDREFLIEYVQKNIGG